MKCSNCGYEFDEGIFCPECGTKNDVSVEERQKAQNILDELDSVENEKKMINQWGWSNDKDVMVRIIARLEVYSKVKDMNVVTEASKKTIQNMKIDIINDYSKLCKEADGIGIQTFWAVVFTVLAIVFGFPAGILGIIIGILFIYGGWAAVNDKKRAKALSKKLETTIKQLQ